MKRLISSIITFLVSFACTEKSFEDKGYSGEYFGQIRPSGEAELFVPGFISTGLNERDACFSPDGKEFYFTIGSMRNKGAIVCSKLENGYWTTPEVVTFSGKYYDIEPVFHPDGDKLFFVSNRPVDTSNIIKDFDIWYVTKTDTGWSEPKNIGAPVSTDANEFYPSFTKDGTVYFCAIRPDCIGGEDIFYSEFIDGKYTEVKNMGDSINTASDEYNAYISPDGDYILYTTHGWGEGIGSGDIYIAFHKESGEWSQPVNMGEKVNSFMFEFCPSISYDGEYMFFTSHRTNSPIDTERLDYKKMMEIHNSPGHGRSSGDIYWISTKIIDEIKPSRMIK